MRNRSTLKLDNVNVVNIFNSCVILQYCTIASLKEQCGMGWHCDSKYSKKGSFLQNSNTQLINSPVIIFTIGTSRILKWSKQYLRLNSKGSPIWHYHKSLEFEMLLQLGNIV